jgi:hypothetical protein
VYARQFVVACDTFEIDKSLVKMMAAIQKDIREGEQL